MASNQNKNEMTIPTEDGEMKICVMNITPQKAVKFLSSNANNRNLRQNRVSIYASEMQAGNWKSNGVPIVFGNDGELKDGQHRLQACIKSGKTMKNTLVVYLSKSQANCYDIGAVRTPKDIAKFAGLGDIPYYTNTNMFSAIRLAITGRDTGHGYSKITLVREMQKHPEACEFVYYKFMMHTSVQRSKLRKSAVAAAIFNAHIAGYSSEKLERFCQVLLYGKIKDESEEPIITLRDTVIMTGAQSKQDRTLLYYKTQMALHAFANNQPTVDLKKAKTEYYPYPQE